MDDNRFDPENQTENEKPSVYRILREYWDDVERQEAAREESEQRAFLEMAEEDGVRLYNPGRRRGEVLDADSPVTEDTMTMRPIDNAYSRAAGEPPMSVKDILSQYWRDNPQAMVDRVPMPEPKPEPAPAAEIAEAEQEPEPAPELPPEPDYDVRDILWEYWRQQAREKKEEQSAAPAEEPKPEEPAEAAGEGAPPETEEKREDGKPAADESPAEPETEGEIPVVGEPDPEESAVSLPEPEEPADPDAGQEAPAEPAAPVRIPRYNVPGDYHLRIDSSPVVEPESEQEAGGYRYEEAPAYDALDILREYWTSGETSELEDLVGHIRKDEEPEESDGEPTEAEPEKAGEDAPAEPAAPEAEESDPAAAAEEETEEETDLHIEEIQPPEEEPVSGETEKAVEKPMEEEKTERQRIEEILAEFAAYRDPEEEAEPVSGEASEAEEPAGEAPAPEPEETEGTREDAGESAESEEDAAEPETGDEAEETDEPEEKPARPQPSFDLGGLFELPTIRREEVPEPTEEPEPSPEQESPEERGEEPEDAAEETVEEPAGEPIPAVIPEAEIEEPPEEELIPESAAEEAEEPAQPAPAAEPAGGEQHAPVSAREELPYSMSVDDILAEYKMLYREDYRKEPENGEADETAPAPRRDARAEAVPASEEPEKPENTAAPDPFHWEPSFDFLGNKPETEAAGTVAGTAAAGVALGAGAVTAATAAVGAAATGVSAMADEALQYIASLTEEDYDKLRDEAAYNKPAKPRPVRPVRRGEDREKSPGKRKSIFSLGEETPEKPAEEINYDELYNLSGREETIMFNGQELDLSPDADYVPPTAPGDDVYHWVAGEENQTAEPEEEHLSFFQRLMRFNGAPPKKREEKKPLNAPRQYSDIPAPEPSPEKTSAPAEHEDGLPADFDLEALLAESFDDDSAAPAAYAAEDDYGFAETAENAAPETAAPQPETEQPAAEPDLPPEKQAAEAPAEADANRETPADTAEQPLVRKRPRPAEKPEEPEVEEGDFPSFGQYLLGLVSTLILRLRGFGGNPSETETMAADDEDLGPEVTPGTASRYYASFIRSLRIRLRIALVLLAVLAYISLGFPVTGTLKTIRVASGFCLGLQLTIMLLCLDVLTNAAVNLARGRFGADALTGFACVLTSLDALAVAINGFGSPHMPLCLLTSVSLVGVLASSLMSARALRKGLRVPAIGKTCYAVTGETGLKGPGITLLKSPRPATGFVRRSEEAAPDETVWHRAAPALLLVSLLFTVIVAAVKKSGSDFLYVLTAFLSPAVPVTALLAFAAPYFVGSMRIFSSGAAVAGWSGLCDLGRAQNLIVTDRDLFPEGSVQLDTIRIFADAPSEKIISYAGTMITASGSGISPCFAELMQKNGGSMRKVDDFEYLPGGGMRGIIDGETVLCGGMELMRLMNVRIPYRLVGKTTVLLAIDGVLYGIFNMKYEGLPQVRKALVGLIRSNRHPIFAVRDFNVTPEMLHQVFDVATDGYDFPPYVERFALSETQAAENSKIAAVVCREGLGPLVHAADTGRSMFVAVRINLVITLLAALLGVLLVLVRFLSAGTVGVGVLLLWALLWALPVAAVSLILRF